MTCCPAADQRERDRGHPGLPGCASAVVRGVLAATRPPPSTTSPGSSTRSAASRGRAACSDPVFLPHDISSASCAWLPLRASGHVDAAEAGAAASTRHPFRVRRYDQGARVPASPTSGPSPPRRCALATRYFPARGNVQRGRALAMMLGSADLLRPRCSARLRPRRDDDHHARLREPCWSTCRARQLQDHRRSRCARTPSVPDPQRRRRASARRSARTARTWNSRCGRPWLGASVLRPGTAQPPRPERRSRRTALSEADTARAPPHEHRLLDAARTRPRLPRVVPVAECVLFRGGPARSARDQGASNCRMANSRGGGETSMFRRGQHADATSR